MRGQAHVVFRDIQTSTQAMRALQGFELFDKEMVSKSRVCRVRWLILLSRSLRMVKANLKLFLNYEAHSNPPLLRLQPRERLSCRNPFSAPHLVRYLRSLSRTASIDLKGLLKPPPMARREPAKRRKNLTRMRFPWKKMRTTHQWKRMTMIESSTIPNSSEPRAHLTDVNILFDV